MVVKSQVLSFEGAAALCARFGSSSRTRERATETTSRRRGTTLRASITYSVGGNAFYLLTQFGILASLAHLRGPIAVGEFGLALALTTPIFFMSNMGLRTAQSVDVAKQFTFAEYGGVRVALTFLAVALCLIVGLAYSGDRHLFFVIVTLTVARAFDSISNLAYGAFQQMRKMEFVARSYFIRGCITLPLFVAMLLGGADLTVALLSQVVVWASIALLLDYPAASRLTMGTLVMPRWVPARSWHLVRRSVPLSLANFANSVQDSVPRLLIEHQLGLEALGIFTAVSYFLRIGIVFSNSVSQAVVSTLARHVGRNDTARIRTVIFWLAAFFLLSSIVGIAVAYYLGAEILIIVFGFRLENAETLLNLIAICIAIRLFSSLAQSLLIAQQRFAYLMTLNVSTLLLVAIAGYFAIGAFGIVGAGFVLVGAAAFRLLFIEASSLFFGGWSLGSVWVKHRGRGANESDVASSPLGRAS